MTTFRQLLKLTSTQTISLIFDHINIIKYAFIFMLELDVISGIKFTS